jgi:hypothetical protein
VWAKWMICPGTVLKGVGGWFPVTSRMPANPEGYGDLRLCVTSGW